MECIIKMEMKMYGKVVFHLNGFLPFIIYD